MNKFIGLAVLAACVAVACAHHSGEFKTMKAKIVFPIFAEAVMYGRVPNAAADKGYSVLSGLVRFTQAGFNESVQVSVNLTLSPVMPTIGKIHGLHVHEMGTVWSKNTTARCGATGGHYNPKNETHGLREASSRHVGDMGNMELDPETGRIEAEFTDEQLHLVGFHTIVGRAVVLHEKEDDGGHTGKPLSAASGAAGARIACGDIIYTAKF